LLFAQVFTTLGAIFVAGFVASRLGDEGFGELNGADSFVMLFSPIVFAGIQVILIREIVSANTSKKLSEAEKTAVAQRALGDAIVLRLVMTPVFIGLVWLIAPLVIPQIRHILIWIAIITWFLNMYQQTFTIPIESSERMHFMAIGSTIAQVVGMALSVVAVILVMGPEGVLGARATGMASAFLYLIVILSVVFYRPKFDFNIKRYTKILKQGAPLAIYYLMGLILLEIDKTMLTFMASLTEDSLVVQVIPWIPPASVTGVGLDDVGQYSSATILAYKFEMVVMAFQTAIIPSLVTTWAEGKTSFEQMLGRSVRFVLILGVPMAIGTGFIARDIMDLIYDDQYLAASHVLGIIIWFIPFQFMNRILASSLAATEREKWVPICVAVAVLANVVLNSVFIPLWNYEGAGIATVITEGLLVSLYFIVIREHLVGIYRQLKIVRVIAAIAVLTAVCFLTASILHLHFVLIIAIAVVVYGFAVLGLKCIDREEIRTITGR
jgi:O-antigen/teichoic acid export membrane protein